MSNMKNVESLSDGESSGSNFRPAVLINHRRSAPRRPNGKFVDRITSNDLDENGNPADSHANTFKKPRSPNRYDQLVENSPPNLAELPAQENTAIKPKQDSTALEKKSHQHHHHKTNSFDFQLQKAKRNSILSVVDNRKTLELTRSNRDSQNITLSSLALEEEIDGVITSTVDEGDQAIGSSGLFSLRSIYGQTNKENKTVPKNQASISPEHHDSDTELDWSYRDGSTDDSGKLKASNKISFQALKLKERSLKDTLDHENVMHRRGTDFQNLLSPIQEASKAGFQQQQEEEDHDEVKWLMSLGMDRAKAIELFNSKSSNQQQLQSEEQQQHQQQLQHQSVPLSHQLSRGSVDLLQSPSEGPSSPYMGRPLPVPMALTGASFPSGGNSAPVPSPLPETLAGRQVGNLMSFGYTYEQVVQMQARSSRDTRERQESFRPASGQQSMDTDQDTAPPSPVPMPIVSARSTAIPHHQGVNHPSGSQRDQFQEMMQLGYTKEQVIAILQDRPRVGTAPMGLQHDDSGWGSRPLTQSQLQQLDMQHESQSDRYAADHISTANNSMKKPMPSSFSNTMGETVDTSMSMNNSMSMNTSADEIAPDLTVEHEVNFFMAQGYTKEQAVVMVPKARASGNMPATNSQPGEEWPVSPLMTRIGSMYSSSPNLPPNPPSIGLSSSVDANAVQQIVDQGYTLEQALAIHHQKTGNSMSSESTGNSGLGGTISFDSLGISSISKSGSGNIKSVSTRSSNVEGIVHHQRNESREESEINALLRKGYSHADAILIIAKADEAEQSADYTQPAMAPNYSHGVPYGATGFQEEDAPATGQCFSMNSQVKSYPVPAPSSSMYIPTQSFTAIHSRNNSLNNSLSGSYRSGSHSRGHSGSHSGSHSRSHSRSHSQSQWYPPPMHPMDNPTLHRAATLTAMPVRHDHGFNSRDAFEQRGGAQGAQHFPKKPDADAEALEIGILLSQQEAAFGINMYDALTPFDDTFINRLTDAGYSYDEAVLKIFSKRFDSNTPIGAFLHGASPISHATFPGRYGLKVPRQEPRDHDHRASVNQSQDIERSGSGANHRRSKAFFRVPTLFSNSGTSVAATSSISSGGGCTSRESKGSGSESNRTHPSGSGSGRSGRESQGHKKSSSFFNAKSFFAQKEREGSQGCYNSRDDQRHRYTQSDNRFSSSPYRRSVEPAPCRMCKKSDVQMLTNMGFSEAQAVKALIQCNHHIDNAASLLVSASPTRHY